MRIVFFKRMLAAVMLLGVAVAASGCYIRARTKTQPNAAKVEKKLVEYQDELREIREFLCNEEYATIYIVDASGTMLANTRDVEISDTKIKSNIKRLFRDAGYHCVAKCGNTIYVRMWQAPVRSISCGVAYSIDGVTPPDVQYMTELQELSVDGWYCYVADYDLWRTQNK
jgi:hypothetical protein